ncbi:MAG: hypothetical protein IR526_01470 [Bordetella sp.]|nr:MAG: hypothetical protein IR526_01470 [Bordetella sp.]
MTQLGLLKSSKNTETNLSGNRKYSKQPISHDSALPPGFGTIENNGMNGAKLSRTGVIRNSRQTSFSRFSISNDYHQQKFSKTGLMVNGGYANGHPLAINDNKGRKKNLRYDMRRPQLIRDDFRRVRSSNSRKNLTTKTEFQENNSKNISNVNVSNVVDNKNSEEQFQVPASSLSIKSTKQLATHHTNNSKIKQIKRVVPKSNLTGKKNINNIPSKHRKFSNDDKQPSSASAHESHLGFWKNDHK